MQALCTCPLVPVSLPSVGFLLVLFPGMVRWLLSASCKPVLGVTREHVLCRQALDSIRSNGSVPISLAVFLIVALLRQMQCFRVRGDKVTYKPVFHSFTCCGAGREGGIGSHPLVLGALDGAGDPAILGLSCPHVPLLIFSKWQDEVQFPLLRNCGYCCSPVTCTPKRVKKNFFLLKLTVGK